MATLPKSYISRSSLSCSKERGYFKNLIGEGTAEILAFLRPALPEPKCSFDYKGRGNAVNIALYAWDADQSVGVVQVRHTFKDYENSEFMTVHKTYVLCGFNENGEPFRHPVSPHTVRAAIRKSDALEAGVIAAQKWMWGVTDKQLEASRRQGDVLIVPHRGNPKKGDFQSMGTTLILAKTHIIEAEEIIKIPGKPWVFAKKPVLRHTKREHRNTTAPMSDGQWFTVRAADVASNWDFGIWDFRPHLRD
ncbi:hypothetical protein [Gluconobacter kondonii]|uniref:hypothetical protein n=1 Tax=Gluconobacter kondonii TaxID=941463 RepID=UPI001B8CB336|nr:hypothetical protein [Gluconobacter kondonii]MBS1054747.1 hypothetical protein [Gluconobacter kondonii]